MTDTHPFIIASWCHDGWSPKQDDANEYALWLTVAVQGFAGPTPKPDGSDIFAQTHISSNCRRIYVPVPRVMDPARLDEVRRFFDEFFYDDWWHRVADVPLDELRPHTRPRRTFVLFCTACRKVEIRDSDWGHKQCPNCLEREPTVHTQATVPWLDYGDVAREAFISEDDEDVGEEGQEQDRVSYPPGSDLLAPAAPAADDPESSGCPPLPRGNRVLLVSLPAEQPPMGPCGHPAPAEDLTRSWYRHRGRFMGVFEEGCSDRGDDGLIDAFEEGSSDTRGDRPIDALEEGSSDSRVDEVHPAVPFTFDGTLAMAQFLPKDVTQATVDAHLRILGTYMPGRHVPVVIPDSELKDIPRSATVELRTCENPRCPDSRGREAGPWQTCATCRGGLRVTGRCTGDGFDAVAMNGDGPVRERVRASLARYLRAPDAPSPA